MRISYNHNRGVFELENFHVSLFRCRGLMEKGEVKGMFGEINRNVWGIKDSKIEQL